MKSNQSFIVISSTCSSVNMQLEIHIHFNLHRTVHYPQSVLRCQKLKTECKCSCPIKIKLNKSQVQVEVLPPDVCPEEPLLCAPDDEALRVEERPLPLARHAHPRPRAGRRSIQFNLFHMARHPVVLKTPFKSSMKSIWRFN